MSRFHYVEAHEIEQVTDLIEAGLGLGMSMEKAVEQALITVYGDHAQFRSEQPKWSPAQLRAARMAGVAQ